MALFQVTYYDKENQLKNLEFEQPNQEAIITFLKRQGITPVSIKRKEAKITKLPFAVGGISVIEKEIMSRHLSTLIKIGTSLFDAVELLAQGTKNARLKRIYADILQSLEQGRLFSSVFERYPRYFSEAFTGIVRVGEATGTLDQSFALLADQLEKQRDLQRKVTSALVYPMVLVFAIIGLFLLVMLFVIPRISEVFGSSGLNLPASTRILIAISKFISSNPIVNVTLLVVVPILIGAFLLSRRKVREFLTGVFATLPGFRTLILHIRLARLGRNMVTMVKSGLTLTQTLEISARVMKGSVYEKAMENILEDVKKGISLTSAIEKMPHLFPNLFVGMVRVGEKTATLDEVLGHMADFYEEEADASLKNLSTFIEPALLIVIGLIVMFIAVAVLVPIYSIISNIS